MELSIILGISSGLIFLILGILFAGGSILMFWDPASVMITFGGCTAALLVGYSIPKLLLIPPLFRLCLFPIKHAADQLIITIVSFSEKARREGLLALEDDLEELDDPFMRKGIQLVVDGTDPELVRHILECDIEQMIERHDNNKRMFDDGATYAPAFGMIGTLMGLVMMLLNLQDRASVGPYLAVAIITTFYGALACYLFFQPIGGRLDMMTNEEVTIRTIILEGVLSIQSGDNPRIVKDKLVAFLPPSKREAISQEVGD